jgi:hypothetical protein
LGFSESLLSFWERFAGPAPGGEDDADDDEEEEKDEAEDEGREDEISGTAWASSSMRGFSASSVEMLESGVVSLSCSQQTKRTRKKKNTKEETEEAKRCG